MECLISLKTFFIQRSDLDNYTSADKAVTESQNIDILTLELRLVHN